MERRHETIELDGLTAVILFDEDSTDPRSWATGGPHLVFAESRSRSLPAEGDGALVPEGWRPSSREECVETAQRLRQGGSAVLLLDWYEHSGISIGTRGIGGATGYPFSDRFDATACVGFAYMSPSEMLRLRRPDGGRLGLRAFAEGVIREQVAEYAAWLNGECYGFSVRDDAGRELDACFGFIGERAVRDAAEAALAAASTKIRRESERPRRNSMGGLALPLTASELPIR